MSKNRATFLALCIKASLDEQDIEDCRRYGWSPSRLCRYCGGSVEVADLSVAASYWHISGIGPAWFACHSWCLKDGYAAEAKACQILDADCNDCRHFSRSSGLSGVCAKDGSGRIANPGMFTGMKCFEHRRDKEEGA